MKVGWIEYARQVAKQARLIQIDPSQAAPAAHLQIEESEDKADFKLPCQQLFQIKLIDIWDESLYSLFSSWIFLFFLRQFCKAGTRLDFEGGPWGKTITLDWAFPPLHIVHSAQSTSQSTSQSTTLPILCNAQSTHNQIHNPLHNCTTYCEALYFCTAPHWPS